MVCIIKSILRIRIRKIKKYIKKIVKNARYFFLSILVLKKNESYNGSNLSKGY